jgi:pimeloyl-ACP methyl ester carboxylesterase
VSFPSDRGVLEPLQTKSSLEGQIEELKTVLKKNGDFPVILIGFSWGAWLSFIFSAKCPSFVKKLILIGSGPFEEKYAERIKETRLNRLNKKERTEVESLYKILYNPKANKKNEAFSRFGALLSKADTYDPLLQENDVTDCDVDIFKGVCRMPRN